MSHKAATWRNNVLGPSGCSTPYRGRGQEPGLRLFRGYLLARPSGPGEDESWPSHALATAAYGRQKWYLERVLDVFERDHADVPRG